MGDRFPSLRGRKMRRILTRLCGAPVRNGRHYKFIGHNDQMFVYGYHDDAEISPGMVRSILVEDVGLSVDEARREVGGR